MKTILLFLILFSSFQSIHNALVNRGYVNREKNTYIRGDFKAYTDEYSVTITCGLEKNNSELLIEDMNTVASTQSKRLSKYMTDCVRKGYSSCKDGAFELNRQTHVALKFSF